MLTYVVAKVRLGLDVKPNLWVVYDDQTDTYAIGEKKSSENKKFNQPFGLDIVFDSYVYDYVPNSFAIENSVYVIQPIGSVYKIIFQIDLEPAVLLVNNLRNSFYPNLMSRHLIETQIRKLYEKKSYQTTDIGTFITEREGEYLSMDKWTHFRLDDAHIFNWKKKTIGLKKRSFKFRRKGGLIETNNLGLFLQTYFATVSTDLIICPDKLKYIYQSDFIITYEELGKIASTKLIGHVPKKNPFRIIALECRQEYLSVIKFIAGKFSAEIIWIVNSLPLKYYFGRESRKLTMNNILTLSNVWIGLDNTEKKSNKKELIRFFLTEFNLVYAKYLYAVPEMNTIRISDALNQTDRQIASVVKSCVPIGHQTKSQSKKISNLIFSLCGKVRIREQIDWEIFSTENCPICYETDFVCVALSCGHTMCLVCILTSLIKGITECPICRGKFSLASMALLDRSGQGSSFANKIMEYESRTLCVSDISSIQYDRRNPLFWSMDDNMPIVLIKYRICEAYQLYNHVKLHFPKSELNILEVDM